VLIGAIIWLDYIILMLADWVLELWWNDTDGDHRITRLNNLLQFHFVHHKYHTDWRGIEPGLFGDRPTTNPLSHVRVLFCNGREESVVNQHN